MNCAKGPALKSCCFILIFFIAALEFSAAEDPRSILEKSFVACRNLDGGKYRMTISKKLFYDKTATETGSECKFLAVPGDSAAPSKFFVQMNDGDGTLCMSNDFVELRGKDSSGAIYSRNTNQGIYRGAWQSEGLFPPFFQPYVVFSLDRMDQTTFIVRLNGESKVMGKACYKIQLIDLVRAGLADGQRQEKIFLIDKETWLPVGYEEKTITRLNTDSLVKEAQYQLTELSLNPPHDSLFTYKAIPEGYSLRNISEVVYHHHHKAGSPAPPFKAKESGGDTLRSESLKGKKTLLAFFSRTSYPSLKSLAPLQQLQDEHPGFDILLVGADISEKDLKELLDKRRINIRSLANAQNVADAFFITAFPAFVLIDETGKIVKMEKGFGSKTLSGVR